MQHGQVVPGLGQLGVVPRELHQQFLSLGRLPAGAEHAGLDEAHLRIARVGGDVAVGARQGGGGLAVLLQALHLGVLVGQRGGGGQQQGAGQRQRAERGRQ